MKYSTRLTGAICLSALSFYIMFPGSTVAQDKADLDPNLEATEEEFYLSEDEILGSCGGDEVDQEAVDKGTAFGIFGRSVINGVETILNLMDILSLNPESCREVCSDVEEYAKRAKNPWCFNVCAAEYPIRYIIGYEVDENGDEILDERGDLIPIYKYYPRSIQKKYFECHMACGAILRRKYNAYCAMCKMVYPDSVPTPTPEESATPTAEPTEAPTAEPTEAPTAEPTEAPTAEPTEAPTAEPTAAPTAEPTEAPTAEGSGIPSAVPTQDMNY